MDSVTTPPHGSPSHTTPSHGSPSHTTPSLRSPHFAVDHVDHVVVNCRDVETTADWYVRVLGMVRETFAGGRTALRFGDQKLNLRPTGAPNWVTAAVDRPGTLDLCFIADASADVIGAHLRACGVEITEGPVTKTGALGPMTSHYCRDPDDNLIEVASYLRAD